MKKHFLSLSLCLMAVLALSVLMPSPVKAADPAAAAGSKFHVKKAKHPLHFYGQSAKLS